MVEEGEFIKGEMVRGKRICDNGELWIGSFANQTLHGEGRHVLPSGVVISGQWDMGLPKGSMTYLLPNDKQIEYDMESSSSHWIRWKSDHFVYYGDLYAVPAIECYFNGNLFVGAAGERGEMRNGYVFQLLERGGYRKMQVQSSQFKVGDCLLMKSYGNSKKTSIEGI